MNEVHKNTLRKLAYLQALGVPSYVSRRQAPGAAPSQRLVVVRKAQVAPAAPQAAAVSRPRPQDAPVVSPGGASAAQPRSRAGEPAPARAPAQSGAQADSCRFSLVAMLAGRWLWLESLGDMPLTSDQVNLVQAMAHALGFRSAVDARAAAPGSAAPQVSTFDWPMHSNRQLDSGIDAAKAGLAAFLGRRIEQQGCAGIVLMGDECARWAETARLEVPAVTIASTAQMLNDPALKRDAWQALQSLSVGVAAGCERA